MNWGRGEGLVWAVAELGIAAILGAIFISRELARTAPILPVDLFRRPIFALSVGTSICSYTAQGTAFVALPFLFEDVGHLSQIATGLLMTPWPAIVVIIAPIAGRLSDRSSPTLLGAMGLAVMTVGMALLLTLPADAGVGRTSPGDGGLRLRVRVLPVAQQPPAGRLGAARSEAAPRRG